MSAVKIEINGTVLGLENEDGQVTGSLKVHSIDGTFVEELNVEGTVALDHLPKGGYVLSTTVEGKTIVKRFFKS